MGLPRIRAAEDLAGLFVSAMIATPTFLAGHEAIRRLGTATRMRPGMCIGGIEVVWVVPANRGG